MSQSGEKTEKATPKRRRDAREKGQVRKSSELNTSLLMVLSFGTLSLVWDYIAQNSVALFQAFLSPERLIHSGFTANELAGMLLQVGLRFFLIVAPILAVAVLGGMMVNYLQVGFLFTTKTLAPKFSRINPLQGFKRMFSIRSAVELIKSLLKVVIIVFLCYGDIRNFLLNFPLAMTVSPPEGIAMTMRAAISMGLKISVYMLAIGLGDFMFQTWKYEKDMRMTKQEIKDEYKMMEGDPQIKGKIRQKQRQMAAMRMMQSVPDADVVITNPTHYAVALKYDTSLGSAPVVLAKGKDFVALKIKEIAAEHRVYTVENRPLAQSLYAMCDVGDFIPETLYQAVAEILAMVYKLKKPQEARAGGGRGA